MQLLEPVRTRKVRFAFVDATLKENHDAIFGKYTGGKTRMNTPTVLLYGQNKNHPFEFRGIYSANPLSIFIKNFCDDNGYGERNTF